jgi:hypothetical protein
LSLRYEQPTQQNAARVKYREIIADKLSEADWSWGCVSAIDSSVQSTLGWNENRGRLCCPFSVPTKSLVRERELRLNAFWFR